jgi:hypothetical protein
VRSWWVLPVVTAVVLGVLLGSVLYLVRPLHLTASGVSPTGSIGSTLASKTPARSVGPTVANKTPVPNGPAFTKRALLQPGEFIQYKWAKADELSLTTGVSAQPILRCLRPDRITTRPVAAYAATHHGLTTLAGEQVIRYYSVAEAENVFDQLAGQVDDCADRDSTRRAKVGKRHDPDLAGISQTRWWNITGSAEGDPMRGVLVIMRVDDRLMALCLTANSTDPAKTTNIIPLMRQGGLRMV